MIDSRQPASVSLDRQLEWLTVFVVVASLAGLLLGRLGLFTAPLTLLIAALAAFSYALARPAPAAAQPSAWGWQYVVPVLLVALMFRLLPYPYVLGGQDQGVYTNLAAELVATHDLALSDPVREKLSDPAARSQYLADNYGEVYVPGFHVLPQTLGLEFQFYHVFPVWLALFGGLFGIGASVYAVTFLSLVSIVFFQRLTAELTGSARLGMVSGLLLALNPLHAFFSKFPVTEVPTLAFSLAGFTWLARYALSNAAERRMRWLALSTAAFACLFLTRISGFMYLPILLVMATCALAMDTDRARARAINGWAAATVACYAASVAYGMTWARLYSVDIYDASFERLLGDDWSQWLLALGAIATAAWLAIGWLPQEAPAKRLFAWFALRSRSWMGMALLFVLALGAVKIYQLGFTPKFVGDPWLSKFPGVAGEGWSSVAYSSLATSAVYLCPLVFVALLVLAQRRWKGPAPAFLLFFVLCFFFYAALLNWNIPYQPYYARYLVSELVPYSILFVVCCLAWVDSARGRRALVVVLSFSAVYYGLFSAAQLGKIENQGARESIARVAGVADDGDVILLDKVNANGYFPDEIKTPLVYTFGRNVISVTPGSVTDVGYLAALDKDFDDVFLASSLELAPPGFERVDGVRLQALSFKRSAHPPMSQYKYVDGNITLFRLNDLVFGPGSHQRFDVVGDGRIASNVGRKDLHAGIISDGSAGFLLYGPYVPMTAGSYRLQVRGEVLEPGAKPARIDVVNGEMTLAEGWVSATSRGFGQLVFVDFDVPADGVQALEVRAEVASGAKVRIKDYTITRLR